MSIMTSPSMVTVTFICKASPSVQFDTAWTLETDPKQFVSLVCSHFNAKEVLHLVKAKYASPLDTFCKLLQKRLSGDQKLLEGEVVEDGMVTVTTTVQIVADPSGKKYPSPDVTVSAPETIAKAEAADTNHGFGMLSKRQRSQTRLLLNLGIGTARYFFSASFPAHKTVSGS